MSDPGWTTKSPWVVHFRQQPFDVYVGRPSPYGNPWAIGVDGGRLKVIRLFREWVYQQPDLLTMIRRELKGKVLGCHCRPEVCHGDVLALIANAD